MASSMSVSLTNLAPASIIRTAFLVPATTRSRSDSPNCGKRRVHDQLAVHAPDAHGADRAVKGNVGDRQGGGGGDHSEGIGKVVEIHGEGQGDHLNIVAHAIGEQRTKRAVDQAGGEDGFFGGPAAALDKAAGDFADGVLALFVVAGKGEEIDSERGSWLMVAVAITMVSP